MESSSHIGFLNHRIPLLFAFHMYHGAVEQTRRYGKRDVPWYKQTLRYRTSTKFGVLTVWGDDKMTQACTREYAFLSSITHTYVCMYVYTLRNFDVSKMRRRRTRHLTIGRGAISYFDFLKSQISIRILLDCEYPTYGCRNAYLKSIVTSSR